MSDLSDFQLEDPTEEDRQKYPFLFQRQPSPDEPIPGPSRLSEPPPEDEPLPGPSRLSQRPPEDDPVPGPSRLPGEPVAGPSGISSRRPQAGPTQVVALDSSDSDTNSEITSFRSKNHKRRKVAYKNLPTRGESDNSDSDYSRYSLSPPLENSSSNDVVFENSSFIVRLNRISHSRHSRFNISDHLYDLKFEIKKKGKDYALVTLFHLIHEAVLRALQDIMSKYERNFKHQIYTTVVQKDLLNGLNTGGYSMATPPKKIVDHMLNMIESFLTSNEAMTLDNSFKVIFKVLSVAHVNHRILNDPDYVPHRHRSEIPGHIDSKKEFPSYIISFPSFCKLHNFDCFENQCVPLTIQFCLARKEFKEKGKSEAYFEFINFKSSQNASSCKKMHKFMSEYKEKNNQKSFVNQLATFVNEFRMQFHFFDADQDYKFIESYPPVFSHDWFPVYLCYFHNQKHLTTFSDYAMFCSKKKQFYCFACAKYFTRRLSFFHRCNVTKTCFACCRPFAKESFYDPQSISFCDSEIAKPYEITYDRCQKCNMTFTTKNCKNNHFRVCHRGVKFECCGHYIYKAEGFSSHKALKENHQCSEKKCPNCHAHLRENVDKTHQCTMLKYDISKSFPTLGYIHFMKENPSGLNCYVCQTMPGCAYHSSKDGLHYKPALCSLYIPKSPTTFEVSTFTSYNISLTKKKIETIQSEQFFSKGVPIDSEHDFSELKAKDPSSLSLLEELMQFIILEKVSKITFLCFCPEAYSMIFILDMLMSAGLSPKIINKHNSILFIDVPELQLKFLNLINFLPFASNYDVSARFFPENCINMNSVIRNVIPQLKNWFLASDSLQIQNKKQQFYDSIKRSSWDFLTEMISYSEAFTNEIIAQTDMFLSEARTFQIKAFSYYGHEFRFLHPFKDSITKSGYIYKLFLFLDLNYRDLYVIPREYTGIFDRTSKKETQFVQYLTTIFPDDEFIHAFSPYGQRRFKTSAGITIPDAINVSKKIAIYFHGCFFHAHDQKYCKMKKIMCKEKTKQKREEFQKKVNTLVEEFSEIDSVIVEWECVWDQRKKVDPEVKNFMKRKFIDRPSRRLVPREARKYDEIKVKSQTPRRSDKQG